MTHPDNDLQELDLDFVRRQFPFFETKLAKDWAFFDNAGGSFPCAAVVDRLTRFYRENKVQPSTHNALARAAHVFAECKLQRQEWNFMRFTKFCKTTVGQVHTFSTEPKNI